MTHHLRALLPMALVLCGCEPVLSADTFKLEALPPDLLTGPAMQAVQTKDGRVYAVPSEGGLLRLAADGGAWDVVEGLAVQRFVRDFQANEALGFAAGSPDVLHEVDGGFVPLMANQPQLTLDLTALRGRDATGTLWAAAVPTSGMTTHLSLWRLEATDPSAWKFDLVPLENLGQTIPASNATLTSDARLFFRAIESGVWEVDRANKVMVERVTCDHELFRPTHPDYRACQEDTFLVAGRGGELFILNPHRELWRIPPSTTTPMLMVRGELPRLDRVNPDGTNRYSPGAPSLYVDPRGRVWLSFRWGNNDSDDTAYLYVVDPAQASGWTFLSGELPRNIVLFGNGERPLLSSQTLASGLMLYRLGP